HEAVRGQGWLGVPKAEEQRTDYGALVTDVHGDGKKLRALLGSRKAAGQLAHIEAAVRNCVGDQGGLFSGWAAGAGADPSEGNACGEDDKRGRTPDRSNGRMDCEVRSALWKEDEANRPPRLWGADCPAVAEISLGARKASREANRSVTASGC